MFKKRWCVGFMFDRAMQKVVLIKGAPEKKMFADLLNGIGGAVGLTETPLEAMHREGDEEAGVIPGRLPWVHYATLEVAVPQPGLLYCFRAEHWNPGELDGYRAGEEGVLKVIGLGEIHKKIYRDLLVPNCRYLIPMAVDQDQPIAQIREAGVDARSKMLNLGFEIQANGSLLLIDQDDGRHIRNHLMLYDDEPLVGVVANVDVHQPGYVNLTIRLLLRPEAVAGMFSARQQGQLDLPLQEDQLALDLPLQGGDAFKVYNELPDPDQQL